MMMMMKLPILPCAEKLELVLSTAPKYEITPTKTVKTGNGPIRRGSPNLTHTGDDNVDAFLCTDFSNHAGFCNSKNFFGVWFSSVQFSAVFFQYHQRHKVLAEDLVSLGVQRS